jgi:HTH-type transcriptional regulator/antitoxin HigA
MNIKPIHNSQDYQDTLSAIDGLMSAARNTPEGDQLDILVTLVEAWEREHCPMPASDPVEAIRFVMEQRGLEVKDLEPMIGKTNRIYEVLNRKRPLTLSMIKRLHKGLGIPAELLL